MYAINITIKTLTRIVKESFAEKSIGIIDTDSKNGRVIVSTYLSDDNFRIDYNPDDGLYKTRQETEGRYECNDITDQLTNEINKKIIERGYAKRIRFTYDSNPY